MWSRLHRCLPRLSCQVGPCVDGGDGDGGDVGDGVHGGVHGVDEVRDDDNENGDGSLMMTVMNVINSFVLIIVCLFFLATLSCRMTITMRMTMEVDMNCSLLTVFAPGMDLD